jgi:hypothetical protein
MQRWGIDIIGPLPTTQGNLKYAFVAVEYFTRWIEAKASNIAQNSTGRTSYADTESPLR